MLFSRVSFSFSCVREWSSMISSNLLCNLEFLLWSFSAGMDQSMSGRLNSPVRTTVLEVELIKRDNDKLSCSSTSASVFGGR